MKDIEFLDPETAEDEPVVDADALAPRGQPCESCGFPVELMDKFCPACGATNQAAEEPPEPKQILQKFFRCDTCSAEVATDPDQRSYLCPFCDSTYVVEFSPELTNRQEPEFVIGFAVTPEQAREKFLAWIKQNSWYRPGDLRTQLVADKQKGVYLPFWSFSMLAQSNWSATIGEYWYRTETYTTTNSKGKTVTKTRQVRETEWWPLRGRHHKYHGGFLVSGSRGLSQTDAQRIKPFQLPALKRYRPYFLAGWLSEEYLVPRDEASRICKTEFHRREQSHVAGFLPGDTHRSLSVTTSFQHVSSDLCLLPVYILSYRYKEKVYRFLVNGQTGKIAGDKPVSWKRIAVCISIVAAVIALAVVLGILLL